MIPFSDIRKLYQDNQQEYDLAIKQVCQKCSFILGPEVKDFEVNFANYLGVKHAIGVANGTDALTLALKALEIGVGDEVLIPANTFIATAIAVHSVGATIVPVDVNPNDYLIDLDKAEKKLTAKTKAIIPVHLYGQSLNMNDVIAFAKKNNLLLIEDACQSHGSEYNNKKTGTFGLAGCFSFYPAKNLGCFGDGGMVVTDSKEIYEKLCF